MKNDNNLYQFQRYPARTEAVEILRELAQSGFLNQDTVSNLEDIMACIENEKYGVDLWGAAYANVKPLFERTSDNEDEVRGQVMKLWDKYKMQPRNGGLKTISGGDFLETVEECVVTKLEEGALR